MHLVKKKPYIFSILFIIIFISSIIMLQKLMILKVAKPLFVNMSMIWMFIYVNDLDVV